MAGNYPNPISWRMAYDLDGTQAVFIDGSNNVTSLTSTQLQQLNSETTFAAVKTNTYHCALIFPELRDIAGYYARTLHENFTPSCTVATSVDSTNGLDGTWVTLQSSYLTEATDPLKPTYRTTIQSQAETGVKALRFYSSQQTTWSRLHVYGATAAGENPDRLEIWHPTNDERLPALTLDLGNVARSSSQDVTFRVKNLSATKQANSVTCSLSALTDTTPSVPGQFSLSANGTTFTATCSAGTLAAGAISSVLTLRRVTPNNAVLGLWDVRLTADASSWT